MNVAKFIDQEELFHANCLVISNSRIATYEIVDGKLEIGPDLDIGNLELTDIHQNFSREIEGSRYVGGEASAHGSCGFFYKKTGESLDWALMSLESDPFVDVELSPHGVTFTSSSGSRWAIADDDIASLRIEQFMR